PVPSSAATGDGSSGTAYSFSNNDSVLSQLAILVSPDWKKTAATKSRTARSASGAPRPSTRPAWAASATRRASVAALRPCGARAAGMALDVIIEVLLHGGRDRERPRPPSRIQPFLSAA